jgi:hypothetical protein
MANKEFEDLMRDSGALLEKIKETSRGPEEDMVIFHWNDAARSWDQKSWQDWMCFRGLGEGPQGEKFRPMQWIGAGEHYFVVCIVDEDRTLYNIHPHRYLIDQDGRIADDRYFGVLSEAETERYEALNKRAYQYPQTHPLNEKEKTEFDSIRERLWHSWLPPKDAAMVLIRQLPGFPKAWPDRPQIAFLAAFGISDQKGVAN